MAKLSSEQLEELITGFSNANCWVHGRRFFADAIKALKKNDKAGAAGTIAGQALKRIAEMYDIE